MSATAPTWLDLYEYRQRVAQMYRERAASLIAGEDHSAIWQRFRTGKDVLYREHPQSPLNQQQRQAFSGLGYFPFDPALCVEANLVLDESDAEQAMDASGPHVMRFRRAGRMQFTLAGTQQSLVVYWIDVYGGGLFLPFRDATCGTDTYGGGRYLFDTVKGSDFVALDTDSTQGYAGGRVLLDFNVAYNPSCAYDARWICPLAPPDNRLTIPIRAGELAFHA